MYIMGRGPPSQRWKRVRNRAQKGKHTSRPMLPVDVSRALSKHGADGVDNGNARGSSSPVGQPQSAIDGGVIHGRGDSGNDNNNGVAAGCASGPSSSPSSPASAEFGALHACVRNLFEIESQLSEVSESSSNENANTNGRANGHKKPQLAKPGEKIHYGATYYSADGGKYTGVAYRPYRVVGPTGSHGVLWIPASESIASIKKNLRAMGIYLPDELAHVVFMCY